MRDPSRDDNILAGAHHARFIDGTVPLHIISRIFQGRHLLRPCEELNTLIIGVIGRACELFRSIEVFNLAFMSNHMHMMIRGGSAEVPAFVGFVKREISRRWGGRPDIDWPGTMWHEYLATALPTEESQENCYAYIMAQGVKENLVLRPQDWPGVHGAKAAMKNQVLRGRWFDATGYVRAVDAASRASEKRVIKRADYVRETIVTLAPLPAWEKLSKEKQHQHAREVVNNISRNARSQYDEKSSAVLGAAEVKKIPLARRTKLAPQPWCAKRRRMICWANKHDKRTQAYVEKYWQFQNAFREASAAYRKGEINIAFPPHSFLPMLHRSSK